MSLPGLAAFILNVESMLQLAGSQIHYVADCLQNAGIAIGDNDWSYAEACLLSAHTRGEYAAAAIGYGGMYPQRLSVSLPGALELIDDNWPEGNGYELTMDDMLSVMLSASFENLQEWIGIIDAYRVALWNAPFNSEYYAALARGFEGWG